MILIVINRTAVTIVIINNVAIDNSTRVTGIEFSVNFYKRRYNKVGYYSWVLLGYLYGLKSILYNSPLKLKVGLGLFGGEGFTQIQQIWVVLDQLVFFK